MVVVLQFLMLHEISGLPVSAGEELRESATRAVLIGLAQDKGT